MSLRHVVDNLRKEIAEAERNARIPQYLFEEQIEIASPPGHEPRAARGGAERTFGGDRGAGPTGRQVVPRALARSLPRGEIQLSAQAPAEALGICAAQQRHMIEHVAIDHRHGPTVLDQLDRVHQEGGRDVVEPVVQVLKAMPPDAQLAVEIVRGVHARERLHGAQRIVERHPAKLSQIRAAERLLAGYAALAHTEYVSTHDDPFVVCGRPLAQADDDVVVAGSHLDVALRERVPDQRDVELVRGRRKAVEAEPALRVGRRGLRGGGHFHEHSVEHLARTRIDDRADDDAGGRLRVRQRGK